MADSEEDEPSLVDTAPTPGSDGFTVLERVGELIEHADKNSSTVCAALLSTLDKVLFNDML